MTDALIDAQNLSRRFDARVAVDALNLQLLPGRVLALLGPNGAGKTTTMRMLSGLLAPSSGTAKVCGYPLGQREQDNDAIRARCGVVPEAPGFYERLTAAQNLRFFAGMQGMPDALIRAQVGAELARFGLADRADDRVGTFSKGMKQRLALARALLHDPALLFLDEPTAGLDPRATEELHSRIKALRSAGKGIVLSTHSLEEAESLADEVLVMDSKALFYGRPAELRPARQQLVIVRLAEPLGTAPALPAAVQVLSQGELEWRCALGDLAVDTPALVAALVAGGARILSVEPQRRGLREAYLELLAP